MELRARYSPFTTFCEGPENIEKGYRLSTLFHKRNFYARLPKAKDARILVVSSGVGYFQYSLKLWGYTNVLGIDSDEDKVKYALSKGLESECHNAFSFLEKASDTYDFIFVEQEINHLTRDEFIEFLERVHAALTSHGKLLLSAANCANPIIATEYLGNNIDHYISIAENGLYQYLDLAQFKNITIFAHDFYVLWNNPLNYIAKCVTGLIHLFLRVIFVMYGKKNKIFTKRLGAVCSKM
jgi:SAM-dependent methyltransferase